jgi:hypothetical protein
LWRSYMRHLAMEARYVFKICTGREIFFLVSVYYCSWCSDKATLWILWGFESRQGQKIFCSPNIQSGPGAHQAFCSIGTTKFFAWGGKASILRLIAHLHLVPRLGMRGAVPPLPCVSSWHVQGQLYLYVLPCSDVAFSSKHC